MKSKRWITMLTGGLVLGATQVASAHPGHFGHEVINGVPVGQIALVLVGLHIAAAGVLVLRSRSKRDKR